MLQRALALKDHIEELTALRILREEKVKGKSLYGTIFSILPAAWISEGIGSRSGYLAADGLEKDCHWLM